ncbi:MAG TPA: helix-turn-helix domain-containing protein [Candidatus Paceibacterota bacterium]|nr:helix-turn-helix domain-containing protein [Candidatus Paceibacterota bacterium]HMO82736.1 helix-turn-helix domain-containing protein [Candidatus Paceibacterota bacterium]
MSESFEINGISFLPIKDAAKLVSYSRDYVARLAREKKIVASQIGRQWFIDVVSLKSFAEAAILEQSVRQQYLSSQRKREQSLREEMNAIKKSFKGRSRTIHRQAQLVSCLALVFGLLAGTGLFTFSSLSFYSGQTFEPLAVAEQGPASGSSDSRESESYLVSHENLTLAQAEPQVMTVLNSVSDKPVFADETEVRELSEVDTKGIFLLPRNGQIQDIEKVRAMFSDDLNIKFIDDSTGVIVYFKENGERIEFPFVSVPLHDETTVKAENQ